MNDVVIDTISRNIRCLEQGRFQSFCQEFFKIHFSLDFERRGATSDGNTRAGTPDYLLVADNQVCLQISVEDTYWSKNEKKPKHDIDRCIEEIADISKIILCSNQGIPTNNTDAKKHIINYAKTKKHDIEIQCFSLENFEEIISYNLAKYSNLIKESYFSKNDIEYLKRYYNTKDDYKNWCLRNLEFYKNFVYYNDKLSISRDRESAFYSEIEQSNKLIYLVSPSGNGKSNLCYSSAKKYIENNKFALWIKSEMVNAHENYEHWIIDALKEADVNFREEYYPYFKELYTRDGLLLIIDNVNPIMNKSLKEKFKFISSVISTNKHNIRIVCPIWNINKEDCDNEECNVFYINNYENIEAENALEKILIQKNIVLSNLKKKEIIKLLNNDPYLIGLMEELSSAQIRQLTNETVDQICNLFVDNVFCEIEKNNPDFYAEEYKNALYSLIYDEIKNARQNTKLSEIVEMDKIRPILKNEKICKLDKENIVFRHDRLKRFLQVQSLLKQEQVSNDILSNPYYNEILGEYIAYTSLSDDKIQYIQKSNPIAILNTINYITTDSWWDTDVTILRQIKDKYKVNVFVFDIQSKGISLKYPHKEESGYNNFIRVTTSHRERNILKLWDTLRFWFKIKKYLMNPNSITYFIPFNNMWLVILLLLFGNKKRTIIATHDFVEHSDEKKINSLVMLSKKIYNHFLNFNFYSKTQLSAFKKLYPNKNAFYFNMPLKDFGVPTVQRKDTDLRNFLFFGSFRHYKRLDWFIKAANDAQKNAHFYICGYSSEWEEYKDLIKDNSKFTLDIQFIDNKDIPNIFSIADYLVLPYDSSTQSGPSLIAINYGIPIIASNLTAFKEVITDNYNGFLFNVNDFSDFEKVIDKASGLSQDKLDEMKENQKKYKQQYVKSMDITKELSDFIGAFCR